MIHYKKLKKQIHRGGIGYVWEATPAQRKASDWQMFLVGEVSKRKLLKELVKIISDKSMNHWRKEFYESQP